MEMSTALKFTLALQYVLGAEKRGMDGESTKEITLGVLLHSKPSAAEEAVELILNWHSHSLPPRNPYRKAKI